MNQSHCLTMTPLRTLATPRLLTSSSKAHGSFTSSLQLLSLHHCGCHRCVVVLLRCCCVVAVLLCCCSVVVLLQCCCVVAVLLCLCMALDVVDVIPGLPWALPLPTLFILAIHLVDGLGPRICPHCCVIIIASLVCHVVSCYHHIVTMSCHVVAVSLSSLHCRCVMSHHRHVFVVSSSLLHCCHVVVVVALSPCCVVSSSHCCCVVSYCHCIVAMSCHVVITLSHCCVVIVVALLQSLCGEHGAAGPRVGTGGSYSITWDAAAIVGECR